ncbi:hypothetical protein HGRIS_007421 [Hohenbuehelia grisea]|uniref:SH3 domain-containing protein n=1 Tax=Hohenbuehelia grisea TaxID=104357 RepID=A0ABR3J543_9AGAR
MKLNSPLPQPLPKECEKAAKIFKSFVDRGNNGLDGIIPRHVLENAKGFAIFTIFKAGFLFSARAGSGIVIAKGEDGLWSAPSAIGTAGVGVGGQAGAEMTDFLIVLNSRSAIASFMAAGSLTLGGNMSIALGPLGRNGEATGSLNTKGKLAAMYSYSKTRGLFGGVSIEGSVIVERQDANAIAYGSSVTAKQLLGGMIDSPPWAASLIKTIQACTGMPGNQKWVDDAHTNGGAPGAYAFPGMASPTAESPSTPSYIKKKEKKSARRSDSAFPPEHWGAGKEDGSYFTGTSDLTSPRDPRKSPVTPKFETHFESDFVPDEQPHRHPRLSAKSSPISPLASSPDRLANKFGSTSFDLGHGQSPTSPPGSAHYRSMSSNGPAQSPSASSAHARSLSQGLVSSNPFYEAREPDALPDSPTSIRSQPHIHMKPELSRPLLPHEGVARAIALFDFVAVESGDLSFSKGDVITITQKSNSSDDWWTGKVDGRQGIFPANFVELA